MDRILLAVNELKGKLPKPHYAAFDADNTLWEGDIAEAVLKHMARHNIKNGTKDFETYYQKLETDVPGAYRFGATTLAGLSVNRVGEIVRSTILEEGTEMGIEEVQGRMVTKGIRLRTGIANLFRCTDELGIAPWVVSASPEILVRFALREFGLATSRVIGVRNVIRFEEVTADLQEPLSIYDGKVTCLRNIYGSVRPLLSAGDSANDGPMLDHSHLRVVVDRGNSMAQKAKAEGWFLVKG